MSEPKLLRLAEQHPELSCLFSAARAQEPTRDVVERIMSSVRRSATEAVWQQQDEPAFASRPLKQIWTTRAVVLAGALGLAAGAFAAVGISHWAGQSAIARAPAGTAEAALTHTTRPLATPTHGQRDSQSVPRVPDGALPEQGLPLAGENKRSDPEHVRTPVVGPTGSATVPRQKSLPNPKPEIERNPSTGEAPPSSSLSPATDTGLPGDSADARPVVSPQQPAAKSCPRERGVIDQARDALAMRRPADALRVLHGFEQQCRFAAFTPEALQLRMKAQDSLGQTSSAIETAQRLWTEFPGTAPGLDAQHFLNARQR